MKITAHKIDIAVKQLETAIDLFIDHKDYICAITLAGAAEEILGTLIRRSGKIASMDELSNILQSKYAPELTIRQIQDQYLNKSRNSLKHANIVEEDIIEIEIYPEAISIIARAIGNLLKLDRSVPYNAMKFFDAMRLNVI